MSVLTDLSTALADAVENVSPSLVYVDARRGYGATGLAWTSDGSIITANHVVQRDDDISVTIPGRSPATASVVGRDRGTDIVVLKADTDLTALIEPSDLEARVGNLVLALGSAIDSSPAASFGVIATINRPWRSPRGRTIDDLIRSDVTLYPGFSGGPLIDVSGRVLGMNTSALTRGLAATLPWTLVEQVAGALVSQGSVKRGYLGVVSQPVEIPAQMRTGAGVDQETGLLVMAVEPDSPAAASGLLVGDILTGVDDRTITGIEGLQELLGPGSAGRQALIKLLRGGTGTSIEVTFGER